ncbi:MAG: hypothetical protein ACI9XK_004997 [Granulosicoccus sp.]|jgi:hypothetical protein
MLRLETPELALTPTGLISQQYPFTSRSVSKHLQATYLVVCRPYGVRMYTVIRYVNAQLHNIQLNGEDA